MKIDFKRGYTIYSNTGGKGIMLVAPHSGPALASPVTRDDHSETVAMRCFELLHGKLVVSSMPRDRMFGVDFNRYIPTLKTAIDHYNLFNETTNGEAYYKYLKKYGWVAKDEKDYYSRLQIYQNFWEDVCKGKIIIFVHKNFPKIKAVPSIMDIVTFSQKGIKKDLIKEIVEEVNAKYFDFFQKIALDYKQAVISETKRYVLDTLRIYEHFNPNEMSPGRIEGLQKDLKKITEYCDPIALNRLKRNFTPFNYLATVRNALDHSPLPCVTVEAVHDGSLALGPVNKLFPHKDKTIIEVECNGFLNFWHPHMAAKIIKDVVEKIKENESN
ncbi:MAG: hypothetical protein CMH64_00495 [Nanoarchaeota archaeon]|nr:hypothetical protein [Nanoarchaeota archaeon]